MKTVENDIHISFDMDFPIDSQFMRIKMLLTFIWFKNFIDFVFSLIFFFLLHLLIIFEAESQRSNFNVGTSKSRKAFTKYKLAIK